MSNPEPITNFKTKIQKNDSSASNLRDPNIIFPTSRKEADSTISEIINSQTKTSPVMLRSFNKDLSESMDKKKDSVSISAKDRNINQIHVPTKAEIASLKTSLNTGGKGLFSSSTASPTASPKIPDIPKMGEVIKKDINLIPKVSNPKIESTDIFPKVPDIPKVVNSIEKSDNFIPKPVNSENTSLKPSNLKESGFSSSQFAPQKISDIPKMIDINKGGNNLIPNIPNPKTEGFGFKGDVSKAVGIIREIVPIEKVILPKKETESFKKDFSSEIFPRPPQSAYTKQQEFVKKDTLKQPAGVVVEDTAKKQKLWDEFDQMIHGEDDDSESSQPETNTVTDVSTPDFDLDKKNNNEGNLILPKGNNDIHVSADDLKKFKEEILSSVEKEKELQLKLQSVAKQEIDLTEEENKEESEKIKIKQQLNDILEQESKIESFIHSFEEQERQTTNLEKLHSLEQERWSQEEKRTQIEKSKWALNEEYEKILASLKEKNIKLEQLKNSKDSLNKEISVLLEEKKQKESKIRLGEIEQERIEIENTQMVFLEEKKSIDKTIDLLKDNRQKVLEEKQVAEENEQKAETLSEKRIFEEKRQNIEIRQRSIEQQTWEAKQKLEKVMEDLKKTNECYNVAISKEEEERKRL